MLAGEWACGPGERRGTRKIVPHVHESSHSVWGDAVENVHDQYVKRLRPVIYSLVVLLDGVGKVHWPCGRAVKSAASVAGLSERAGRGPLGGSRGSPERGRSGVVTTPAPHHHTCHHAQRRGDARCARQRPGGA